MANLAFKDLLRSGLKGAGAGFKGAAVERYLQTRQGQSVVKEAENQTIAARARDPNTWLVVGGVVIGLLLVGAMLRKG